MTQEDNTPFMQDMTEGGGSNSPLTGPQSTPPRSNARRKFTDFDEQTRCRIFDLNSLRSTLFNRQLTEGQEGWQKVRQNYLYASSDTRAEMLFAHRLLVSYGSSMSRIQYRLNSTPPSLLQEKIIKGREELINSFAGTEAGKNWIESMRYQDADDQKEGWQYTATLLWGEQSKVSINEIDQFFLTLDEISILTDLLHGEGEAYGIPFKPKTIETKKNEYNFLLGTESVKERLMEKLLSLTRSHEKPKDKMRPIRAAIDAGVMPRITYEVFKQAFDSEGSVSKSTYNDYTNPNEHKYSDNAYFNLIDEFKAMVKVPDNDDDY